MLMQNRVKIKIIKPSNTKKIKINIIDTNHKFVIKFGKQMFSHMAWDNTCYPVNNPIFLKKIMPATPWRVSFKKKNQNASSKQHQEILKLN